MGIVSQQSWKFLMTDVGISYTHISISCCSEHKLRRRGARARLFNRRLICAKRNWCARSVIAANGPRPSTHSSIPLVYIFPFDACDCGNHLVLLLSTKWKWGKRAAVWHHITYSFCWLQLTQQMDWSKLAANQIWKLFHTILGFFLSCKRNVWRVVFIVIVNIKKKQLYYDLQSEADTLISLICG